MGKKKEKYIRISDAVDIIAKSISQGEVDEWLDDMRDNHPEDYEKLKAKYEHETGNKWNRE